MSNKDMKEEVRITIEYFNSGNYTIPTLKDEVVCCKCGKHMIAEEASHAYTANPLSLLHLPPEMRKYYCKECF